MADSMYANDDSQVYSPKTRMILDLQKQIQKLNMRVDQSERSESDRHERRKARSHRINREDRWRNHVPSEDESEGRTYSEYIGSARNARRNERNERRQEREREYENNERNERRNENERRDRRNDRNDRRDRRDERFGRDREIDRDIRLRENKLRIPIFHGKSDVEAYLDWELKIEQIFTCHEISNDKKVKLATLEFQNYALLWWDKLVKERVRYDEPPISTWDELKKLMRKRYVPSYYHRELLSKLQSLTQGSNSVEEYHREMEMALIRANLHEDEDELIVRFLNGLNHDIRDIVELHNYLDLQELVHQSIRVEQQLKRKGKSSTWQNNNFSKFSSSKWKDNKKGGNFWSKSKDFKANQNKDSKDPKDFKKSTSNPSTSNPKGKDSNIKCFKCLGRGHIASQCPTKKTMIIKDNGSISSINSSSSSTSSSSSSESEQEHVQYALEGDLLVIRRLLGSVVREGEESQRENIFHTRCLIKGHTCSLIIDGGSCTNVASSRLVQKLSLDTTPHPKPYKLQWLSDNGDLVVDKQVFLSFSIGKYSDQILCDVVPMEASHVLLGRPWQFDRDVHHDGHTNTYSFQFKKQKITLMPLSPSEVCRDQNIMRGKREVERKCLEEGKKEKNKKKGEGLIDPSPSTLFVQKSEIKHLLLTRQPLYMLCCKPFCLNSNKDDLPSDITSLLHEFQDVFPQELPKGLPPIRGIEHQIDFMPSASLPNRPAYRDRKSVV